MYTMKQTCMHNIDDCMQYKNNVNKMYPNCRKILFSNGDIHSTIQIRIQEAENLQGTGAFKLRGAYHKLHSLTQKEREKGVIAASAGNHAQGVAYSCMKMGIKGTIVMPKTAPLSKIEATRSYGVAVELQGDTFNDAYEYAKNLQEIRNESMYIRKPALEMQMTSTGI